MNGIIIDDEATARLIVTKLCDAIDKVQIVSEFSNAIQAIKFLNENQVDLIFLDIHMPDFTGFDFIKTLKNPPRIILTTSDKNFALDAFGYSCIVDYLVKPITLERLQKAVDKAANFDVSSSINNQKEDALVKELYVNIDRRLIKIIIADIYLIEAKGDYIHIKTTGPNYIVHSTMKKMAEKLPDSLFLKVHRSYIINLKKIIDIEDNSVLIEKDVVPVSRSNRQELMNRLNLL